MAITDQIAAEAQAQGVLPALAIELATAESGLNPNVPDSSTGAIGLFQLEPATAAALGVNPRDQSQNISGGVRYLKSLLQRFTAIPTALAAYNAGPTIVSDFLNGTNASGRNPNGQKTPLGIPPYPETQNYVSRIMAGLAQYQPTVTPASVAAGVATAAQDILQAAPTAAEIPDWFKWAILLGAGIGVYWLATDILEE